ncbi:hypothetical protein MUY35_04015 [Aliiroseovarius sp. S1339]|uniref:hypothetical protein n=1 Tax=Aliiroseovarius sp. S1339 TaxID=2936990 RepID=UPI0020BE64EB|nr:hypothetical protein [Aliiroseovarius sp. S1339]MCK8463012.1 hypothetical protein [Aliiroseovarius sp. S1339]
MVGVFTNNKDKGLKVSSQDKLHSELLKHTKLGSITANERDIDVVSFSRSREAEIDWKKIVNHEETPSVNHPYELGYGLSYVKREFEKRLNVGPVVTTADLPRINKSIATHDPPAVWFQVPGYNRRLIVSSVIGVPQNRFDNVDHYENFWSNAESAQFWGSSAQSKARVVELAPAIIHRQYRELIELEKVGGALSAAADKLVSSQIDGFLSQGDIDDLVSSYGRMRSVGLNIQERLERLRDKSSDLGYILVLEDGLEYKYPDGSSEVLQKGQLYQPYETEITWVSQYTLTEYVEMFPLLRIPRTINVTEYHRKEVTKYSKVIPDFDPWVEEENRLSNSGYNVFRFSRVGSKYISQSGEELEDIIERCELDPNFGKMCAVLLPVYEQSLIAGEILSKYVVIRAPRRGLEPIHAPRIYIEEDLVFSTKYIGAEVGELASSINLAPGERREILVEKSTKTELEVRRTATSLSDLNENSATDYASELENEAKASRESTKTQSLSASAGGSYGGFSASASGSSSSSQTTKDFARNLSKVARKAARSVTKQTRLEVQSSSLRKTTTSSRESTKIEIENINDGRSLNLLLFHLYNVYRAQLKLERLTFTFLSGIEVVSGSGIVLPQQFSLDELPELLRKFSLDGLPIRPNKPDFPDDPQEAALERVLDALIDTLMEYHGSGSASSRSVLIPDFPPSGDNIDEKIANLTKSLTSMIYSGAEIPLYTETEINGSKRLSEFLIGSPGLYLDAHIGDRDATEPYSNAMREAEVRRQHSEVREIETRALYNVARASRLGRIDSPFGVFGVFIGDDKIRVTLEGEPLVGVYHIIHDAAKVGEFEFNEGDDVSFEVTIDTPGPWLQPSGADLVLVRHLGSGHEALFLI